MKNNNVKVNESKKNAQVAEAKKPQAKKPQVAPVEAPTAKAKKPTKEQVINNLNAMSNGLAKMSKNKVKGATELLNRVVNAVGNSAKTKVDDLIALNDEVIQFGKSIADATTKKTVENSIKPKAKTEKPKASAEKPKEETLVESKGLENAGILPCATMFPKNLVIKDLGTLVRANAKYKTVEEIANAIEEGTQFYFATYWTAKHIVQFDYELNQMVQCPQAFPNNLDILEPVYYCERAKRIWCASLYTEGMFYMDGDDLSPIEDVNPYSGEKFAVRVSNGMEFELYELAPEAETKKATKK